MKATHYATPSVIPGAVDLQSTRTKLTVRHGREKSIISAVFISALLTSGCLTFNMSPEKFAEQQKGHYDDTPEARIVEVAGYLLDFLNPCSGCRTPDPASEP